MPRHPAVTIDEAIPRKEGEMQIRRRCTYRGEQAIELVVWKPTRQSFPRATIRLRGDTVLDVLEQLENRLTRDDRD